MSNKIGHIQNVILELSIFSTYGHTAWATGIQIERKTHEYETKHLKLKRFERPGAKSKG